MFRIYPPRTDYSKGFEQFLAEVASDSQREEVGKAIKKIAPEVGFRAGKLWQVSLEQAAASLLSPRDYAYFSDEEAMAEVCKVISGISCDADLIDDDGKDIVPGTNNLIDRLGEIYDWGCDAFGLNRDEIYR